MQVYSLLGKEGFLAMNAPDSLLTEVKATTVETGKIKTFTLFLGNIKIAARSHNQQEFLY